LCLCVAIQPKLQLNHEEHEEREGEQRRIEFALLASPAIQRKLFVTFVRFVVK